MIQTTNKLYVLMDECGRYFRKCANMVTTFLEFGMDMLNTKFLLNCK